MARGCTQFFATTAVLLAAVACVLAAPVASAQDACSVRTPIEPNQTINGALTADDCTLAALVGGDNTYVDIYQVTLTNPGTLTITQRSGTIDSFLYLTDTGITTPIASDDDGGGGVDAQIVMALDAGTYVILANSFDVETGPYTLTTQCPGCGGSAGPPIVSAVLPASRSVQVGNTATAFATIINAGGTTATACGIAPATAVSASFLYQTTNPATNAVTGSPNTPVDIAGGASQSYVIALTPSAAIAPTDVQLTFDCANTSPAPSTSGLNTLLLSASATPVADIVALAATSPNDLIARLDDSGAFAVATVNVGATDTITATADTGAAVLPAVMSICQTNPTTGVCLAPPADASTGVTTTIASEETPTFAVFATATSDIPLDPANSRIFVRFRDGSGTVRGATSVAVEGTAAPNPACAVRTPIGTSQTLNGDLSSTDCTVRQLIGEIDDSYVDVYEVTLASAGTLTVTQRSSAIDSFLAVFDSSLSTPIAFDDDSGGGVNGFDAQISIALDAGTYAILANSVFVETGPYTLTTSLGAPAQSPR